MRVRPDYVGYFRDRGWTSARDVMNDANVEVFRRLPDRSSGRVWLPDSSGELSCVGYLKRHWATPQKGKGWSRIDPVPAGIAEADAVALCQAAGAPTLEIVAAGMSANSDRQDSFFLSEEVPGEPADRCWATKLSSAPAAERLAALAALAETARRLHAADLFHRDLYWCHFFLAKSLQGDWVARLIDLQRVRRGGLFRARWLLKDLAQFVFSMPADVSAEERVAWFRHYRGWCRLDHADRARLAVITARARLYQWREGRS